MDTQLLITDVTAPEERKRPDRLHTHDSSSCTIHADKTTRVYRENTVRGPTRVTNPSITLSCKLYDHNSYSGVAAVQYIVYDAIDGFLNLGFVGSAHALQCGVCDEVHGHLDASISSLCARGGTRVHSSQAKQGNGSCMRTRK